MFDNESTTRNGMQSSISREVDRTLASSKKLFADEATRAVEERLAKRSRDTTEEAVQESVKKNTIYQPSRIKETKVKIISKAR